jgi:hypothetical protein
MVAEMKDRLAEQAQTCAWCGRDYMPYPGDIINAAIYRGRIYGAICCPHCRTYQTFYVTYVRTLNPDRQG